MANNNNNFDANTYVKVNERLAEFRATYPNGRITTSRQDTPKGVVYKTIICKDANDAQEFGLTGIAPATGHAFLPYEKIRNDKVEEFTETVSLGRALAILGFKIEKSIASSEEMVRFKELKEDSQEEENLPEFKNVKLKTATKFKLPTKEE